MGLDFYHVSDYKRGDLLFSLNHKELDELEEAFSLLHQKTGLGIDLYGETNFYISHIQILIQILEKEFIHPSAEIKGLIHFLKKATITNEGLTALGD